MLLSFLTPKQYNATEFDDRLTWVSYGSMIVMIIAFVLLCALLFWLLVYKNVKIGKKEKLLFAFVAVFSVPFLNMLERGNIMALALIALLTYAVTYNSPSGLVRELGLLALAFSFSLKIYPVLFAWILFADKRYKEFFRCALYSVVFLVLPSFCFGGPECLLRIVQNIFSFS